ncbi:hypothetical protein MWU76_01985 [Gelidibacter sp. F2691]|nr:hypothetical protein [Gelidibacter sp. F2691]
MALSSSSKKHFHFVCTNYGSTKDGIGHYTSKIVQELGKESDFKITIYSATTHHLSKLQLLVSMRMSLELLRLKKELIKSNQRLEHHYIILEYPFVEYNPLFLLVLCAIKADRNFTGKIVISLHEYSRTKRLRKLFIKLLLPFSDIVLYTKHEDIEPFNHKNIIFKKRIIPANIEPSHRKTIEPTRVINICFFGIINYETKAIENMILGWELYLNQVAENRIVLHIISSSFDAKIKDNKGLNYHFELDDEEVSKLLHKMQFMILPLKPKISANNGSLAVGCIHECLPVGIFDDQYFKGNFGLKMKSYAPEEFVKTFEKINSIDVNTLTEISEMAYQHGKKMSINNSAKSYLELQDL